MTSLYKRYIPPKPAAGPTISAPVSKPVDLLPDPPKRKRERSEEEIAERKAKKAKKKGIPVESAVKSAIKDVKPVISKVKPTGVEVVRTVERKVMDVKDVKAGMEKSPAFPLLDADAVDEEPAAGEFSHVTSTKKRHRLEKAARKAREAAGKGQTKEEGAVGKREGVVTKDRVEIEERAENEERVGMKEGLETKDMAEDEERAGSRERAELTNPAHHHPTQAGPKKRRHKLEAALESSPPPDDDDSHLRKHGAVLAGFQKASKRAQYQKSQPKDEDPKEIELAQPTVQDLEMPDADLPSPIASDDDDDGENAGLSTLPSWLAHPTVISADSTATFPSLGLSPAILDHLAALQFHQALPVQQVLLPLLLPPGTPGSAHRPGTEPVLPDIAVSAATGSGKTLAYLLPIIEGLKLHAQRGKVAALIVVPTRELVKQVAIVAESLAKGSGLRIGTATGSGKFIDEQHRLVRKEYRYRSDSTFQPEGEELDILQHEILSCPPHHIPIHTSALEILIATPGRLLEHLNNTPGFNLVHLQYLVLDEVDKLLDHQSHADLTLLLSSIHRPRTVEEQDARERFLRSQGLWDEGMERRVRKVLLSATMTRDVQRLAGLRLRFPKLVAVEREGEESEKMRGSGGFELPDGLREFVVPVGDGSEKPLVALEWLSTRIFGKSEVDREVGGSDSDSDSEDSDESESGSDDDSASSSATSSSSSSSSSSSTADNTSSKEPLKKDKDKDKQIPPTVLIFTSTTETATRLHRLLTTLVPAWKPHIHLLTKSHRLPLNSTSSSTNPLIIISTDRASRGLDTLSRRPITHVLQYDVPGSLRGYVHRVGRTARGGGQGEAWSFYGRAQAGWFLRVVGVEKNVGTDGDGEGIRRKGMVERVKIRMEDEGIRERFGRVLEEMRGEVVGEK